MSSDSDNTSGNTPSMDGSVRLRVSRDKYTITLENLVPPSGGGKELTLKHVSDKLQRLAKKEKAKRVEGIDTEAIEAALNATAAGTPPQEPVIVAEGVKPEHGEDAEIVWHLDCSGETYQRIVYPQQLLASRKPATAGSPGKDVFGNIKRTRPGIDRKLAAGDNVTANTVEGVTEYRAESWGVAGLNDTTIVVTPPGLQVTDDRMQAYMDIYSDPSATDSGKVLSGHIVEMLRRQGITHGVNIEGIAEALVQAAKQNKQVMEHVLVASGDASEDGRDAVLECYIDQHANNRDERIVFPGQLIARLSHATPGTPGTDIFNAAIPANPGADLSLIVGDNVILKQVENGSEYHAVSMGYASVTDNRIEVMDIPVTVSADGLVACMDLYGHSCGEYRCNLLAEHVIDHANKMQITHGIDEVAIGALLDQVHSRENGCIRQAQIARGSAPVNGHPAHLHWYIDIRNEGGDSNIVVHNQIIAAHMPATKGEAGIDVYGKEIPAVVGDEVKLEAGEGVSMRVVEGVEVLVAERLGNAVHMEGKVSVGKYEVDISTDAMLATMNLPAKTDGKYAKTVRTDDVIELLNSYGVSDGIDRDAIEQCLAQAEKRKDGVFRQAVVARGTPAIHGEDGVINWRFDIQSEQEHDRFVVPGQLIATVHQATRGVPGKGIDGREIAPGDGKDVLLNAGQWIEKATTENGDEYTATCMGILEMDNDTVSVRSPNLHMIDDGLEASMDLYAVSGGSNSQQVCKDQVLDMLQKCGISHGINESIIEETLALAQMKGDIGEPCVVHDTIVAVGRNKHDGVQAQIEIAHQFAPSVILSHGRLDLHELGYPWDVHKNMVLGSFRQAIMGEDGMKVNGEIIPAQQVQEVVPTLSNIRLDDDGKLVAERDGVFLINGFDLTVTDQVIIDKDIGLHTGNIHTESSVYIKGHVTSGFVVEADGDIIIDQNIENATVRSMGNIIVRGGIRGTHSRVEAGGNISAHFVEYGHLLAKNNIEISQSSVDAHLEAGNGIFLGPDPGALITSKCSATGQLCAKTIGHAASDPSEIRLGLTTEQHDRLLELRARDDLTTAQQSERERLEVLSHIAEQSALRVQGAIHSDVILHMGHDALAIKGDTVSCKDYYLDPKTLKVTSRLHDPNAPIPVIHHETAYRNATKEEQPE